MRQVTVTTAMAGSEPHLPSVALPKALIDGQRRATPADTHNLNQAFTVSSCVVQCEASYGEEKKETYFDCSLATPLGSDDQVATTDHASLSRSPAISPWINETDVVIVYE